MRRHRVGRALKWVPKDVRQLKYPNTFLASMARGPTTKCPFCKSALSYAYVKVPRSGKVEFTDDLYYCRGCGTSVKKGHLKP